MTGLDEFWGTGIVFATFRGDLELYLTESIFIYFKGDFMKIVFDSCLLLLLPLAKHAQYLTVQIYALLFFA